MITVFERIRIHIKAMRGMFIIPLAVYYILIPFAAYKLGKSPVYETAGMAALFGEYMYNYVPAVSTLWLFLSLREYVQGQGGELLWNASAMTGLSFGIYLLQFICLLPALILAQKDTELTGLVLQMMVIIFFMHGLAYFLCMVTGNIAAATLAVLVYSIFSTAVIGTHSFWYQYSVLHRTDWLVYGCGYFLAGCLFFMAAHAVAKIRPAR